MSMVEVVCYECGTCVQRETSEVNRSIRKGRKFFCSRRCAATNTNRQKKAKEVMKTCPHCGKAFVSSTKKKAATFCSRSCASAGSMSASRREAQRLGGIQSSENLISTSETLKLREAWKYVLLKQHLAERPHEFEFALGGYVFDLALFDTNILVEFDGPYHTHESQYARDTEKAFVAQANSFNLVRRVVVQSEVILPETLDGL